jgi:hypothetical protein
MDVLNADTIGLDGTWFDPVWRIRVDLTPLERELLDQWWVRRLGLVAHAGAASITTVQNYSRLEHSLGVLALVAHFEPLNEAARAAALLHDIGHLPFSHTLEGLGGLDHHTIGRSRVRQLAPVLERHGLSASTVLAMEGGAVSSPLTSSPGGMKLDHLDSFVRSGQAHGRTRIAPHLVLSQCTLENGTVDTDEETAAELVRLIIAEARAQRGAANVVPIAVLRDLVETALADRGGGLAVEYLAEMTDDELWAVLLATPSTAERTRMFRQHPGAWRLVDGDDAKASTGSVLKYTIRRGYLDLPTVHGTLMEDDAVQELGDQLPLNYRIASDRAR